MIKIFSTIDDLNNRLVSFSETNNTFQYRVLLDANNKINLIVKGIDSPKETLGRLGIPLENVDLIDDKDGEFAFLFETGGNVDTKSTSLRLDNLLTIKEKTIVDTPVITFYSYKGGVGRSTTLASFASYLSIKKGLKIVILDCDFEAPGFSNFFLENPENISYKNGLVEYFLDTLIDKDIPLTNYYWEVSKKFSGDGDIYVFHAGNLDYDQQIGSLYTTNLSHYLQGLSRINISSKEYIVQQFTNLLSKIHNDLSPDLILIDSRTGFNDIFGVAAFRFADVILGFFGADAQSRPGIEFLIERTTASNSPHIILVNSILPSFCKKKVFDSFRNIVNEMIEQVYNNEECPQIPMFPIGYSDVLKMVGLGNSSYEEYLSLINGGEYPDYANLFNYVLDKIADIKNLRIQEKSQSGQITLHKVLVDENKEVDAIELKKKVLSDLREHMSTLYAEDILDFEQEYASNHYFYRKCMEDLFLLDKFLIIGNKGTGKTYIYQSLENQHIVSELQRRAHKDTITYLFIQVVKDAYRFETIWLDSQPYDMSSELYYERFWKIYIWDVLALERPFGYVSQIDPYWNSDSPTALAMWFQRMIRNDNFIIAVENELSRLDSFIGENPSRRLMYVFDGLDSIVKPHQWAERITPLINLCRRTPYSYMAPKLFVRKDLFGKLSNINNKNELLNKAISIEWSNTELFAYFFKFVFAHSANAFCKLILYYNYYPSKLVNKQVKTYLDNNNQFPLDDDLLKVLCATFFGKYADVGETQRFGESYDWFYNNLKNADGTLSLRPFIDLLQYAIQTVDDKTLGEEKAILSPKFYTDGGIRAKAVERHFNDLAQEEGNLDLQLIFKYIRECPTPEYKRLILTLNEFEQLSKCIMDKYELHDCVSADDIANLLKVNGIIKDVYIRQRYRNTIYCYQFAFLYKYYLGLTSRKK